MGSAVCGVPAMRADRRSTLTHSDRAHAAAAPSLAPVPVCALLFTCAPCLPTRAPALRPRPLQGAGGAGPSHKRKREGADEGEEEPEEGDDEEEEGGEE
jgi:hypothetical protein